MENHRLIKAIKRQNLEGVKEFIHQGVNINGFLHDDMTPLIYAIDCCHKKPEESSYDDIILCLINAGANVNVRHPYNTLTALMLALENKRSEEVVRQLIDAGSDVEAECENGKTTLIYAIQNGYSKNIIAELISKGAEVNQPEGFTPLFCALLWNRSVEIVELLLSIGAEVHGRDWRGRNLLVLPCKESCKIDGLCEYKQIIDMLIKRGVDINGRDNWSNTIIHNVTCNYLIYLAVKNRVSIETKNRENLTPLFKALFYREKKKVKDLLLLKANPNCVNLQHFTPLHYKEIMSSEYFVSILLYHGADLRIKNLNEHTPLDMISEYFNNYSISERECGIKIIIQHYLLFINENDLDNYFDKFNDTAKQLVISYINSCKVELHVMRCTCVKEELTFYDFCQLKKLYRNKHLRISVDEYKYCYNQIRDLFPIYKNLIIMRIKDNSKKQFRRDAIKNLEKISVQPLFSWGTKSNVHLVYDCWYYISQYLNRRQLYCLFLASLEN